MKPDHPVERHAKPPSVVNRRLAVSRDLGSYFFLASNALMNCSGLSLKASRQPPQQT